MENWETAKLEIIEFDMDDKSIITVGSKDNDGDSKSTGDGTTILLP